MPIGAVVFRGDEPLVQAHTEECTQQRRIVHADLLAMLRADSLLGFAPKGEPLTLAVNLEQCMMCLCAAITLGVNRVVYALESPNDSAVDLLDAWDHEPGDRRRWRRRCRQDRCLPLPADRR